MKKPQPTTILISSHKVITGDRLTVEDFWQQRHAASNLAHVVGQTITATGDPLDTALTQYLNARALSTAARRPIHELRFDHESGASGTIWHHGAEYQIAVKGMPERILEHCDVSENERELITMQLHAMSADGFYVLAIAAGSLAHPIKKVGELHKHQKLTFVGLVSLKIDVESAARRTVASAKEKGISIYFASGAHPVTAYHLASELGLASQPSDVYDARHLDTIAAADLQTVVGTTKVFARASDKQKVSILRALKVIDMTAVRVETLEDFTKLLAN